MNIILNAPTFKTGDKLDRSHGGMSVEKMKCGTHPHAREVSGIYWHAIIHTDLGKWVSGWRIMNKRYMKMEFRKTNDIEARELTLLSFHLV